MGKFSRKIKRNANRNGKQKFNLKKELTSINYNYFNGDGDMIMDTYSITQQIVWRFIDITFQNKRIPKCMTFSISAEYSNLVTNVDFGKLLYSNLKSIAVTANFFRNLAVTNAGNSYDIIINFEPENASYLDVLIMLTNDQLQIEDMIDIPIIAELWLKNHISYTDIMEVIKMLNTRNTEYDYANEIRFLKNILNSPVYKINSAA